jgi:hypothetical protein
MHYDVDYSIDKKLYIGLKKKGFSRIHLFEDILTNFVQ